MCRASATPVAAGTLEALFADTPPDVILNATGFAVSRPGEARSPAPFDGACAPVLQTVFAGATNAVWRASSQGLSARDIAMNVALPEVDGRILSRAVAFKAEAAWDKRTQCSVVATEPAGDRVAFVAALAAAWTRLRRAAAGERRVAIVLANYPARDGRVGNGVGLDTPAGALEALRALAAAGYRVSGVPADGGALMRRLIASRRAVRYPVESYSRAFARLPEAVRAAVTGRWGAPEADPGVADGAFGLAVAELGNIAIGVQPPRGYGLDPAAAYHDPDLVPPHAYLAFYVWLREAFDAHAVVHFGKHGNLEWLPGKAVALSEECFPEAAFGPLPHLYPFIVNDPGEGSQAKRRAAAVIVDHLTPPMTRAESYGPLAELERLVDEYYEARGSTRAGWRCSAAKSSTSRGASASTAIAASPQATAPTRRSRGSTTTFASSRKCRSATVCMSSANRPPAPRARTCWRRSRACPAAKRRLFRAPSPKTWGWGTSTPSIATWPPRGRARARPRWRTPAPTHGVPAAIRWSASSFTRAA